MLKLLIRNKIVEMANGIHFLWTEGELFLKYFAVMLLTLPFLTFGWYNLIMYTSPKNTYPVGVVILVSVSYHVGFFVFSWIIHATISKFIEWIRNNIEIAKRNEKVTPNWKKEI